MIVRQELADLTANAARRAWYSGPVGVRSDRTWWGIAGDVGHGDLASCFRFGPVGWGGRASMVGVCVFPRLVDRRQGWRWRVCDDVIHVVQHHWQAEKCIRQRTQSKMDEQIPNRASNVQQADSPCRGGPVGTVSGRRPAGKDRRATGPWTARTRRGPAGSRVSTTRGRRRTRRPRPTGRRGGGSAVPSRSGGGTPSSWCALIDRGPPFFAESFSFLPAAR